MTLRSAQSFAHDTETTRKPGELPRQLELPEPTDDGTNVMTTGSFSSFETMLAANLHSDLREMVVESSEKPALYFGIYDPSAT